MWDLTNRITRNTQWYLKEVQLSQPHYWHTIKWFPQKPGKKEWLCSYGLEKQHRETWPACNSYKQIIIPLNHVNKLQARKVVGTIWVWSLWREDKVVTSPLLPFINLFHLWFFFSSYQIGKILNLTLGHLYNIKSYIGRYNMCILFL